MDGYLNLNSQLNKYALVICKISTICSPQRYPLVCTFNPIPWLLKTLPYCKRFY
ncbi:hypothetical protein T09_4711 [Trichinella sp. T9]|nr:hypothetical protein T09_4711 [Trichinella sp. T9]